jgi:hypothetical protein
MKTKSLISLLTVAAAHLGLHKALLLMMQCQLQNFQKNMKRD